MCMTLVPETGVGKMSRFIVPVSGACVVGWAKYNVCSWCSFRSSSGTRVLNTALRHHRVSGINKALMRSFSHTQLPVLPIVRWGSIQRYATIHCPQSTTELNGDVHCRVSFFTTGHTHRGYAESYRKLLNRTGEVKLDFVTGVDGWNTVYGLTFGKLQTNILQHANFKMLITLPRLVQILKRSPFAVLFSSCIIVVSVFNHLRAEDISVSR